MNTTQTPAQRVASLLWFLGSSLLVLAAFGFFVGSSRSAPPNAILLVDDVAHEYVSPPCVADLGATPSDRARYREVRYRAIPRGYRPNADCRDSRGFLQEERSPTGLVLQWVGVLDTLPSRWNDDGTWRW